MIEKTLEGLTEAINNLAEAVRGAGAPAEAAEASEKKPARGEGKATGAAPTGSRKPAAKKGAASRKKPAAAKADAPTRQKINDLVTKLAALDRKACGDTLKKHGKAARVREVDEKHFPALAKGLEAALAKAKEAAEEPDLDDDFDEAEDAGSDDGLDFDDEPDAEADDDLDFDDSDFD